MTEDNHVAVFYPSAEKTCRLFHLRETLREIAARKRNGTMTHEQAKKQAAEAVVELNGGEPRCTSGPIVRLLKLCRNGWIREAADEMTLVYPDLDYPERWGHRKKREG